VSHEAAARTTTPISRRTALRTGVAVGAAGVSLTASAAYPVSAAQDATPTGMRSEHLEVDFTPVDPVSIVRAGSGPPQRGDHFYIDGPIFAAGDVNGTQIGTYQCFGAWTAAGTATDAPNQRLTTIQFMFDDGAIMGLINEGGRDQPSIVGAVQGGTGRYTGALGTFRQVGSAAGVATPEAPSPMAGTPAAGQLVVRAVFDLILPESS
jgi:hypothetical protein